MEALRVQKPNNTVMSLSENTDILLGHESGKLIMLRGE